MKYDFTSVLNRKGLDALAVDGPGSTRSQYHSTSRSITSASGRPPQSVCNAVAPCKIEARRKKELQCAVIIAILIVK